MCVYIQTVALERASKSRNIVIRTVSSELTIDTKSIPRSNLIIQPYPPLQLVTIPC